MNSKKQAVVSALALTHKRPHAAFFPRRIKRFTITAMLTAMSALLLGGGAALAKTTTRYVAPGGNDTLNNCTSKKNPCQTIQHAVSVALPGDTISLDKGTYAEQVTINKSLTLKGEDDKTVIQAPAVMVPDTDGQTNIVEVGALTNVGPGPTVEVSNLTVAGPMDVCGSSGSGIAVVGGATLSIHHAAVRDIRPLALIAGCTNGEGISAGTQRNQRFAGSPDLQVGHIIVSHVEVTDYNRNGIVVAGIGSTGDLDHNTVATSPNPFTVPNGILAINGGVFSADHNKVSGNECNIPGGGGCGPDFVGQVQSGGFLLFDGGPGISMVHNDVTGNDVGIYMTGLTAGASLETGVVLDHNKVNENRWVGIFFDTGAIGPSVSHNDTKKNGLFGIYLGSTISGGSYLGSGSFADNEAKDNATFDLWWDGTGTPTFHHNHCGTALPSQAAWDCK